MIVSLVENQRTKPIDHFFSYERLREGLKWLASESPLQPNLRCINLRDLVQAHLNPKLEVLDEYNIYEVSPNHCISALSEALDLSIKDITASAFSNPTHWPCPEITLLNEFSYEHKAVDWYLPSLGWSSPTSIESVTRVINQCKIPAFPYDLSWLFRGSDLGTDIENQKSELEDCLVKYLSNTSRLMGVPFARKEANAMLQKCAHLKLQGSTYYIVPKWTMIFWRIFSWQLTNISTGALSDVYILECGNGSDSSKDVAVVGTSSHCCLALPSLDEMVEVGRSPFKRDLEVEAYVRLSTEPTEDERCFVEDEVEGNNNYSCNDVLGYRKNELVVVGSGGKEADRLSKLLEQCNIVQNLNAEKLSIYF